MAEVETKMPDSLEEISKSQSQANGKQQSRAVRTPATAEQKIQARLPEKIRELMAASAGEGLRMGIDSNFHDKLVSAGVQHPQLEQLKVSDEEADGAGDAVVTYCEMRLGSRFMPELMLISAMAGLILPRIRLTKAIIKDLEAQQKATKTSE